MSITELPQVEEQEQADELEEIPVLPSEPVPRRAVLLRAAELVEEHGYVNCALGTKGRGFCLVGAVFEASVDMGCTTARHPDENSDRVYDWAARLVGAPMQHLCGWSDMLELGVLFPAGSLGRLTPEPPKKRLADGLRKLADGIPWEDVQSTT